MLPTQFLQMDYWRYQPHGDYLLRFNELVRVLGGASKKIINERLKEMEEIGLVQREVISERPIAVNYKNTRFGKSLLDILEQLKDWSLKHKL